MQYLLMIYGNEAGMLAASKEMATQMSGAYFAYTEAMKKAGNSCELITVDGGGHGMSSWRAPKCSTGRRR